MGSIAEGDVSPPGTANPSFSSRTATGIPVGVTKFQYKGPDVRTQPGLLILEPSNWAYLTPDAPILVSKTAGSEATQVHLPAGRHVLRVVLEVPAACAVAVSSNTDFQLGNELQILKLFDSMGLRTQALALENVQAFGTIISNPTKMPALLRALATSHVPIYKESAVGQKALWEALAWTLDSVLRTPSKETSRETVAGEAVRTAWTVIVRTLQATYHRLFQRAVDETKPVVPVISIDVFEELPADQETLLGASATCIQAATRGHLLRKKLSASRVSDFAQQCELVTDSWKVIAANLIEFATVWCARHFEINSMLRENFLYKKVSSSPLLSSPLLS